MLQKYAGKCSKHLYKLLEIFINTEKYQIRTIRILITFMSPNVLKYISVKYNNILIFSKKIFI